MNEVVKRAYDRRRRGRVCIVCGFEELGGGSRRCWKEGEMSLRLKREGREGEGVETSRGDFFEVKTGLSPKSTRER